MDGGAQVRLGQWLTPVLRRQKQGDCQRFKAVLVYRENSIKDFWSTLGASSHIKISER